MLPVKKLERHIGGTWQVICRIFVDNRLVFHSKPDAHTGQSAENNTASEQMHAPELRAGPHLKATSLSLTW